MLDQSLHQSQDGSLPFGDEYRRQAILQRRTTAESLERLTESGVLARLRSTRDVITLSEREFLPRARRRLLLGVHTGSDFLGVIWACADEKDFPSGAPALLAEFAELAVPALVRRRTASAGGHDDGGRALLRALEDGDHAPLAALWQVPDDTPVLLAGVETAAPQPSPAPIVALLRSCFALLPGRSAVTCCGPTVYVATAVTGRDQVVVVRRTLEAATARVSTLTAAAVLTGLADVRKLSELAVAGEEARRVVRALHHPSAGATTAVLDDVRPLATLLELADVVRERAHLQDGTAARMAVHDRQHGTAYVETLRALLEEFGDVPAAAKRLSLHPNSYRYRLRRLQELFSVDLTDPDARLVLELQLRLAREHRSGPGSVPDQPAAASAEDRNLARIALKASDASK